MQTKTVNAAGILYGPRAISTVLLATYMIATTVAFSAFQTVFVQAAGSSVGYSNSDNSVLNGMIVSVNQQDSSGVEQAHSDNVQYTVGVAVDKNSSSVVFDNDDTVFVATEGTVDVFVSTLGGDITNGDLITVSSIGGVGRKKADDTSGQKIIGIAKADFNGSSQDSEQVTLENAGEVTVGLISMEILLTEPTESKSSDDTNVLVRIGRKIAGKPVSLTQVVITASVIIFAFVISGSLLFGSIKGSFMSIGRNPLSAKVIYAGMMRSSVISLSVMMIGIVAGYVVLIL